MFYVSYLYDNRICKNYFDFEYQAKHFAIDLAYEGFNPLIYNANKVIGRIEQINNCKAFVRI